MRKQYWLILSLVILAGGYLFYSTRNKSLPSEIVNQPSSKIATDQSQPAPLSQREIIAQNLDVPWEAVFLPDKSILITERSGQLKKLGDGGFTIQVPGVAAVGEGGLLGLALHPDYAENNWIYLYHTTRINGSLKNIVERFKLSGAELLDRKMIIENIPASGNHDGGRLKFGPDGFLYITTGDAQNSADAQNTSSLAGKILRVKDDGSLPEDNPFGNAVYSFGHRNVQGLAWDDQNQLWATEHGRSGILSGYDELNLIKKGANYGWPDIQGNETRSGMETPVINSGASDTWAPSGMAFRNGSLFFAGLRGQALYEYVISDARLATHLKGELGRLRDVIADPDGNLYVLTNNTDGRGAPKSGDDKLIMLEIR